MSTNVKQVTYNGAGDNGKDVLTKYAEYDSSGRKISTGFDGKQDKLTADPNGSIEITNNNVISSKSQKIGVWRQGEFDTFGPNDNIEFQSSGGTVNITKSVVSGHNVMNFEATGEFISTLYRHNIRITGAGTANGVSFYITVYDANSTPITGTNIYSRLEGTRQGTAYMLVLNIGSTPVSYNIGSTSMNFRGFLLVNNPDNPISPVNYTWTASDIGSLTDNIYQL